MINLILKIFVFITGLIAISTSASASEYLLVGNVVDSISKEAEPFATLRLFSKNDSLKVVSTFISNENGKFNYKINKNGNYRLIISSIGKNDNEIEFSITDSTSFLIDLGTIALKENESILEEIVVSVNKPIIINDGDKLIYNASEDPSNNSNNVLEMLRKVPMVMVDGEDNITLNGSNDFRIYINGQYDPMISQNASKVLKSMSASSVKEIEIITEPGAKYDAEGLGGIINIITYTKSNFQGYSLNIELSASNRDISPSIYALTKINKVTASINYSFFNQFNRVSNKLFEREDYTSDINKFYESQQIIKQSMNGHIANFQLSYEPDTLNLLSLSGSVMGFDGSGTLDGMFQMTDIAFNPRWSYRQKTNADVSFLSGSVSANYQHNFKKKGHNIILSYLMNFGQRKMDMISENFDNVNYPFMLNNERNNIEVPSNEHTFQIDYTNPINKFHIIELGAKYIMRRNKNNSLYYSYLDNEYIYDENRSVLLNQHQDVCAIYAQYSLILNDWKLKTGVRYEYTNMGVDFIESNYENFNTKLNDVVPNAMISYNINSSSNLRLNYQMRISRPNVDMLNPYHVTINPSVISYGNPNLSSMRQNDIILTYSNYIGKLGYNLSLKYMQIDNYISNYSYVENGVQYDTYDNLGKFNSTVLNLYGYYLITQKMRISLSGSVYYNDYKHEPMNIANSGWSGGVHLDYNYEMPWKLRLGAYGGFYSPSTSIQGESDWFKYYGINLTRKFLKDDRLEVSINLNNLFINTDITRKTYTDSFCSYDRWTESNWKVGISVSYRFGTINSSVKKTDKSINNDDVQRNTSPTGL